MKATVEDLPTRNQEIADLVAERDRLLKQLTIRGEHAKLSSVKNEITEKWKDIHSEYDRKISALEA
jgi:hypothetical protein